MHTKPIQFAPEVPYPAPTNTAEALRNAADRAFHHLYPSDAELNGSIVELLLEHREELDEETTLPTVALHRLVENLHCQLSMTRNNLLNLYGAVDEHLAHLRTLQLNPQAQEAQA